jgi:hypothetical protein
MANYNWLALFHVKQRKLTCKLRLLLYGRHLCFTWNIRSNTNNILVPRETPKVKNTL